MHLFVMSEDILATGVSCRDLKRANHRHSHPAALVRFCGRPRWVAGSRRTEPCGLQEVERVCKRYRISRLGVAGDAVALWTKT
jgi:hypothetical protein